METTETGTRGAGAGAQTPPATGNARGGAGGKRTGLWWLLALGLVATGVAGGLYSMDDPGGTIKEALIYLGETQVRPGPATVDDYLVFLKENTPATRQGMLSAAPGITYLGESLFPGVVVVDLPDDPKPALAALQQKSFVRMVVKYNPAWGCH